MQLLKPFGFTCWWRSSSYLGKKNRRRRFRDRVADEGELKWRWWLLINLRFWEFYRLGPYLIMQSQYVLVDEGTLQEEQKKGGENHKNTRARWRLRISDDLQTTETNNSSNRPLGFITFNGSRKLLFQTQTLADSAPTFFYAFKLTLVGQTAHLPFQRRSSRGSPPWPKRPAPVRQSQQWRYTQINGKHLGQLLSDMLKMSLCHDIAAARVPPTPRSL